MQVRYPSHLLLPKGKKNGMPYSMFILVTPTTTTKNSIEDTMDDKPMGFPFDREVRMEEFHVPNMIEKEIIIYHKKTDETHESL